MSKCWPTASGISRGGIKTAFDFSALTAKIIQRRLFDRDSSVALPLSAPRTSLNVPTGAARSITITSYPLEEMRAIGKAQGATINDVVMTLCDLALRRYFDDKGETQETPLVAYMPVNIRTEGDDSDGNLISLLQVKLASSHEDPLTALQEVRESVVSAREIYSGTSRSAVQYYGLTVALMAHFQEALKLGEVLDQVTNLVISNVPGPRKRLYFRGAELLATYPVSTLPASDGPECNGSQLCGTIGFWLDCGAHSHSRSSGADIVPGRYIPYAGGTHRSRSFPVNTFSIDSRTGAVIRPMQEEDVAAARRIFSLAFGTFIGVPDPASFGSDRDYIGTRRGTDPEGAFVCRGGRRDRRFELCHPLGKRWFFRPAYDQAQYVGQWFGQAAAGPDSRLL